MNVRRLNGEDATCMECKKKAVVLVNDQPFTTVYMLLCKDHIWKLIHNLHEVLNERNQG